MQNLSSFKQIGVSLLAFLLVSIWVADTSEAGRRRGQGGPPGDPLPLVCQDQIYNIDLFSELLFEQGEGCELPIFLVQGISSDGLGIETATNQVIRNASNAVQVRNAFSNEFETLGGIQVTRSFSTFTVPLDGGNSTVTVRVQVNVSTQEFDTSNGVVQIGGPSGNFQFPANANSTTAVLLDPGTYTLSVELFNDHWGTHPLPDSMMENRRVNLRQL
jgi:hypothetical protein